jgi:hypothetical protein
VFLIDEISMLSADMFDSLNFVGKVIRKNKKPFGGNLVLFVCIVCFLCLVSFFVF